MHFGDLVQIPCRDTTVSTCHKIHGYYSKENQCRTKHQHQGQLHGTVFFLATPPHSDQQIFWYHCQFQEEKHHEQVGGDKESKSAYTEQEDQEEKLLDLFVDIPRDQYPCYN